MTKRAHRKLFAVVVFVAALVAGGCASGPEDGLATTMAPGGDAGGMGESSDTRHGMVDDEGTTSTAPGGGSGTSESPPVAESTAPLSPAAESEDPEMGETIDPVGAVEGGAVQRAYLADAVPKELDALVAVMISDLAGRLGIAEDRISVVSVEEVVWSDASLGCPQPGMSYAQVVTDGMRVFLEADGVYYDYRSGGTRDPFLCERAPVTEKSSTGLLELTEDGEIRLVTPPQPEPMPSESEPAPPPDGEGEGPTHGLNPPDE